MKQTINIIQDNTKVIEVSPTTIIKEGGGGNGRSLYEFSGRWYMNTNNSWVTFNATYGTVSYQYLTGVGTDDEPNTAGWNFMGIYMPKDSTMHSIKGILRADSSEVVGIDVRVHYRTGENNEDGSWTLSSDYTSTEIFAGNNIVLDGVNWNMIDWNLNDFKLPNNGTILVYIRPSTSSTLTSTRFLHSTINIEYSL